MSHPQSAPVSPGDVLRPSPLPMSRESEMAVLGAMIFDNIVIGDVVEIVRSPEEFAFPAHQLIFEAIVTLHTARRPIDLITLRDHLAVDKRLEQAGGADYLMTLVEGVPNAASAPEYARCVHDKFFLIYGKYGTTYNYRVYTGSQNWSQDALSENEELFVKMAPESGTVHPIYDAYYTHFNDAYNNGVTCTKANWPCR